jgi:UPF0042 nucleotide-binding protein
VADFVILTGLSGAGRSEAAKHIEDLGWFVIDNLPPELIPKVAELARAPGSTIDRVALAVGSGRHEEVADGIEWLRSSGDDRVRTLFLSARTPVLVQRYEATRRRHPYKEFGSLGDAIESERAALEGIQADADVVIDTSDLHVHQLRDRIIELFGDTRSTRRLQTQIMSFGYKYGLPLDVDMVLDCRFLPNPHWVPELRPMSGRDDAVRDYVLGQELTEDFLDHLRTLLADLLPAYAAEGKAYLTVAFGCTGGRHRSVAIAERMALELGELGYPPSVRHRDIDR